MAEPKITKPTFRAPQPVKLSMGDAEFTLMVTKVGRNPRTGGHWQDVSLTFMIEGEHELRNFMEAVRDCVLPPPLEDP